MLAGIDWMEGRVGARTDTMLVVSVNSDTGEVLMFSFPRDLQRFPIYNGGTYSGKLNTFAGVSKLYPDQFPEPGMPSLAYQIGFMLGSPIDYYASVNMPGFIAVVEAVGGITVCNEREISDDQLQFYLSSASTGSTQRMHCATCAVARDRRGATSPGHIASSRSSPRCARRCSGRRTCLTSPTSRRRWPT